MTSSMPPPNGSTSTTTGACMNTAATCHQSTVKTCTTLITKRHHRPWRSLSSKLSGLAGGIHSGEVVALRKGRACQRGRRCRCRQPLWRQSGCYWHLLWWHWSAVRIRQLPKRAAPAPTSA